MILFVGTKDSCPKDSIIELMVESHLHFIKCNDRLFIKLVYNFCYKNDNFLLVIHCTDMNPDGFLLCIVDARKSLIKFCMSNILMILFLRIKSLFKRNSEKFGFEPCRNDKPKVVFNGNFSWNEHGKDVGKIMMVYVTKEGRGKHVATQMYNVLFNKIKRIDAHVDADNWSSFALHSKLDSQSVFLSSMVGSYLFTFINER